MERESQHGMDGGSSLQVMEVDSRYQEPYWHEERDEDNVDNGMRRLFDKEEASIKIQQPQP